jgi:hypothetical protein
MLDPKTTNKDPEYVILIVFQRQIWLHGVASMLPLYLYSVSCYSYYLIFIKNSVNMNTVLEDLLSCTLRIYLTDNTVRRYFKSHFVIDI